MNGVNWKHVGNDTEDYGSSPYAFFYGNDGEMDSGVITVTRRLRSENVGSIPTRFFSYFFFTRRVK